MTTHTFVGRSKEPTVFPAGYETLPQPPLAEDHYVPMECQDCGTETWLRPGVALFVRHLPDQCTVQCVLCAINSLRQEIGRMLP